MAVQNDSPHGPSRHDVLTALAFANELEGATSPGR
jgi:hypothetical protein